MTIKRIPCPYFAGLHIEDRAEYPNHPKERRFTALHNVAGICVSVAWGETLAQCERALKREIEKIEAKRAVNHASYLARR